VKESRPLLVCFAVAQEARHFHSPHAETLVTGMGQGNATRAGAAVLAQRRPRVLLTCGFAGGLNAELRSGDVVFSAEAGTRLAATLRAAGAKPVSFHCAARVAITAAEKSSLRASTGADAVEMESAPLRALCQSRGIPSATVRVISDAVDESLPLDFNALMTPDYALSYVRLARAVALAPWSIPGLWRLGRRSDGAARRLAEVLTRVCLTLAQDQKEEVPAGSPLRG
jgi:nucleoside phosphorylase